MSKIILNKQSKPFKDETEALKYIDDMMGGKGDLVEIGDGFGIMQSISPVTEKLTYVRCRISPRTSDNEDEIVDLSLNGRQLQVRRGSDVILPEPFVKVAEEAVQDKYELRGSVLVRTGSVSICPIARLGEATEADFIKQVKEGNATRDREIREQNSVARS